MPRSTGFLGTLIIVLVLLLLAGCSDGTGAGTGENNGEGSTEGDVHANRELVFTDLYPCPDKDEQNLRRIHDFPEPESNLLTIYIYVVNHGLNWSNDDHVRPIDGNSITYHDLTNPESTSINDSMSVQVITEDKKTYIKITLNYDHNARGYFSFAGEYSNNGKDWYQISGISNQYIFGDPESVKPPLDKNRIIYEKEYVD
ncbi:MAG: hypothetical protein ACOX3R_04205 [Desulfitobacteriia bacterium]